MTPRRGRDETFPSRAFLRYWQAVAISGLGTYITLFALQTLVVLSLNGSAADVGWLNASRWLPYLLGGLVVGAVVDRYRRRPIMIATDLIQAVLLMVIPVLWWLDLLSLPMLLAIVMVYGSASVVNGAADSSYLPRVVPARHLQRAHARVDGADAASMTAGPGLGGVLVSALGAPLAVVFDAATYLYSAVVLSTIKVEEPSPSGRTGTGNLLREIREGVRWAYGRSGLATIAIATHGWFVGNAIVGVVLAPYALTRLGLSALAFGIIGAVGGVGALLGASVTTRVGLWLGTGRTIIACHAITTCGVLVMVVAGRGLGTVGSAVVLATGQGLYGLAMGMSNSHEMSYRQLVTPDELQARTNTTLRSLNRAVMVVVAPIAGVLADAWSIQTMLLVAAGSFAVVSIGLASTSFRDVRAPS